MSHKRYMYCECGGVFHPDAEPDFVRHVGETGHEPLSPDGVDRYINRLCQLCKQARGVKAFGFFQLRLDTMPLYSWVCKPCLASVVGVPSPS